MKPMSAIVSMLVHAEIDMLRKNRHRRKRELLEKADTFICSCDWFFTSPKGSEVIIAPGERSELTDTWDAFRVTDYPTSPSMVRVGYHAKVRINCHIPDHASPAESLRKFIQKCTYEIQPDSDFPAAVVYSEITDYKLVSDIPGKFLEQFRELSCRLSPKNLSCDGELNEEETNGKFLMLKRQWGQLEALIGRSVTEEEIYLAYCD